MKKLFNSKFLLILASSLVVLILLTVGAFYLFEDTDDSFVKSGYVLNPLSATVEKYFFDDNTGYKENLSSMIEFEDVDKNKVTVLKDSFIHYLDDSMSFLKKGAILDLDSVKGSNAVSFYNITSESMVEKTDGGYVIDSMNGEIRLKNFIGRISENKYIVVGKLNLQMAGNSTSVKGEYFEIVYVEEGIVNIENKDVKYQVTAADTLIYVGSDKVIDLGNKKITVNDDDIMSITSITIDGDENIEIIPKEEETPDNSDGSLGGSGNGSQSGNQTGTQGNGGNGSGSSDGGTGSGGVSGEEINEVTVSLKDANIGSTNVDVTFDVINAQEDDVFMLQVVNLTSGRTVDMVAQVLSDVKIQVNLLTPNTKYLFMVINEKDNGKYFQKVFETTGFGIKLEKMYSTDSALAYKVTVEEGTDITNAKLALYKFNEETKQNEVVTTSYVDSVNNETKYVEKVTYLSNVEGNIEGEHEIIYDGLDSNTIYTAVLDEFSVASSNFKDIYNITNTSMTLKKTPVFNEPDVKMKEGEGFELWFNDIVDEDNAITKYTYLIYDKFTNELAIDPIIRTNASLFTVNVGDGVNELKNDINYYYKVIIEYFDNEKYIEYVTTDSIIFMMGNDPYVTVVPTENLITHNQIGATIYLKDTSCLISMPGRKRCSDVSTTVVEVSRINPVTGERTPVYTKLVTFDVDSETDEIKYDLLVEGLQAGTTYNIEVRANYNNSDSAEKKELLHTDESKRTIATKSLTTFDTEWIDKGSNANHVVNTDVKFIADEDSGSLSGAESADSIEKVVVRLYEGRSVNDLETMLPIATKNFTDNNLFDIKKNFYDNYYTITTDETFGLSLQALKDLNEEGKLSEYYTITIEAYTSGNNDVKLTNNILTYKVSPMLLMDNIAEPVLEVNGVNNKNAGVLFENLTNLGTLVGYKVSAAFDRAQLLVNNIKPQKINFYVYDINHEKLKFYIKNEDGELELVNKFSANLGDSNYYETYVYMDYGTPYEIVDTVMRRGNVFYIGYEIEVSIDGETSLYPNATDDKSPSDYGLYEEVTSEKETPSVKMYVASSDSDSITYKYIIGDPDNALYKDADSDTYSFYTTIRDGEEMKLDLVKVSEEGQYNQFEGTITIDGLNSGDLYSLYYKKNLYKTGVITDDVRDYLDGYNAGIRMFDGFYDAKANADDYNFKYQIINDPYKDNKVIIRILANEEILDRILSYRITFKDEKGNTLNKELWKLNACEGDIEGSIARCLSVDYTDLKDAGMKSDKNETNMIRVSVNALYDNGLTGYDFKVGSAEESDYMYCIMQDNSSEEGYGNYISFSSSGQQVTVWSEAIQAPKGYYTYTLNNSLLFYKSQLNTSHMSNISVNLSSIGYSSKNGILNPKMVSMDEMSCYDYTDGGSCNTFSFNSITPKVSVSQKAGVINGSVMNLTLSGIDLNDLKNESTKGGYEYYLYIETWDNLSLAGNLDKVVRPTVKVKIDSSNPTATISALIDGLKENSTYYFNVYANMYKDNKIVYTQLFDAGITDSYTVKTYEFKTLKASDIFHSFDVGYSASEEFYGNRNLNTKINLIAYKNNISFNFDIVYVMCEIENADNCGPDDDNSKIFKKVIPLSSISTIMSDSVDISSYDLEYDKNYYMYIYASADYYDSTTGGKTKRNIVLNRYSVNVKLKKLTEPSFVVTRNAVLDNGEYAIDFNIMVNDSDKTLVDGKYFIKLLDSDGNIAGDMNLMDDNGNYHGISNYEQYFFSAALVNQHVRITNLKPNEKYTFVVYGDAYLNNYSEDTLPGREHRTYEVMQTYSVYSTNSYGVAFGEATYGVTEKSVVVTFLGGSNFENVTEVNYTVGLWDDNQSNSTLSGTFVIGEDNKSFELYKNSEDWRFVIDPTDMKNILGKTYKVSISFKVKIPDTDQYIILTSADVPSFEGTVTYYEDE